uniref:Uncharacterized protein n=1 Tax=Periophthalmus magnuspinnatus TaxID=409849 RepID=A0A3B3Z659_9GOBI
MFLLPSTQPSSPVRRFTSGASVTRAKKEQYERRSVNSSTKELTRARLQRGSAPQLQRGTAPQLQRGSAPQLQPGTAPQLQRGSAPQLQPGTAPWLQSGSAPQLQSGSAPQLQSGSAPQLQSGCVKCLLRAGTYTLKHVRTNQIIYYKSFCISIIV